MDKVKQRLSDAWSWVKDRAMKSWTMRGVALAGLVASVDSVIPFIPDEYKNKPMFFAFLVGLAVLRSRSL